MSKKVLGVTELERLIEGGEIPLYKEESVIMTTTARSWLAAQADEPSVR